MTQFCTKLILKTCFVLPIFVLFSCNQSKKQDPLPEEDLSKVETPITVQLEYKVDAQLGEGALWNYKTQTLYWVDILGKTVNIYNPKTKANHVLKTPSRVGTVVPFSPTQAVIALEDGIYKINLKTAALVPVSDIEANMPENRFNDGKCDPLGNFWVGSMHLAESDPAASLYRVNAKGEATKQLDSITISNGIVWDNTATTMYYIDTPTGVIKAFDFDAITGDISNQRIAVTVYPADGYPDGMAIDSNNNLWVGLWNGNGVAQYNSTTGALMQKIAVPAHNVTACAFGGPNLDVLYITTASVDMTEEEKQLYPLAGSVFSVIPGVTGVPANFFGENSITTSN